MIKEIENSKFLQDLCAFRRYLEVQPMNFDSSSVFALRGKENLISTRTLCGLVFTILFTLEEHKMKKSDHFADICLNGTMEWSYLTFLQRTFKLRGETYCKCSIHTSRVNACVMPMGLMCTYIYYVRNFFAFSDVVLFLMYAFSFYHMGHLLDLKSPKGFTYYIDSP